MEIKELGKVAFIDRLTKPFVSETSKSIRSFRDDCSVIENGDKYSLLTSEIFTEGVHFDLTLFPLKHLGYKLVVATVSDILAMNGKCSNILVNIAIPARFSVEHIEELYSGVKIACENYDIELSGGDTTASINGLIVSMTAYGSVDKKNITYRSGAKPNDLICITGDLGAAFLGTKLLEREKAILKGNNVSRPQLDGYEYQLRKALKPNCRIDIIENLKSAGITPSSMIDISDGLASEVLHICRESDCGAKIYLEKIPIASKNFELAEELKTDTVLAVMNGGEDYELMFTVDVTKYEEVLKIGGIDVIGHISAKGTKPILVTPDGGELSIKAQGWSVVE